MPGGTEAPLGTVERVERALEPALGLGALGAMAARKEEKAKKSQFSSKQSKIKKKSNYRRDRLFGTGRGRK
jgi:hypothetical protein